MQRDVSHLGGTFVIWEEWECGDECAVYTDCYGDVMIDEIYPQIEDLVSDLSGFDSVMLYSLSLF